MGRKKTKDWRVKSFSLDIETLELLKLKSEISGISETDFIEQIIHENDTKDNPSKEISKLSLKKKALQEEITKIDEQIAKLANYIEILNNKENKNLDKKKEALDFIGKKLLVGDINGAIDASRRWKKMYKFDDKLLLIEAKKLIEESGI
jgi:hypothetical protein